MCFAEEKVTRSMERMKKVLADNGYYQATITYTLEPNRRDSQMAIHFHVTPGPLARVGDVTIDGDTGIPPQQVRSLTKLKAGDKVKAEHVTRALERLRTHYQKNAHLEAQVSLTDRRYQAAPTGSTTFSKSMKARPLLSVLQAKRSARAN